MGTTMPLVNRVLVLQRLATSAATSVRVWRIIRKMGPAVLQPVRAPSPTRSTRPFLSASADQGT